MVTQITTDMLKAAESLVLNAGDVLTFDGAKWIAQPGVPVGTILPFAGALAPPGWLLCAGQEVSRASYAGLFAAVANRYGNGNGATTFNLPDFRGRVPVGLDNMDGASANRVTSTQADILGGAGGNESKALSGSVTVSGSVGSTTLSQAQMPNHSHNYSKETNFTGSGGFGGNASQVQTTATTAVGSNESHSHSFSGSGTLSGMMDVTQPWLAVNYIIKV